MVYIVFKTLICLTLKSVFLRITLLYVQKKLQQLLLLILLPLPLFLFLLLLFFFYLYISFIFTYTMLGRGLRGQWMLVGKTWLSNNKKRVFIYFIHQFISHKMQVVELRKSISRNHYFRTLLVSKKSFYHIHEGRRGPSLVLYIVFIHNGKKHLTRQYSGNLQLQCNKCVGTELESLWHLTEYQWIVMHSYGLDYVKLHHRRWMTTFPKLWNDNLVGNV